MTRTIKAFKAVECAISGYERYEFCLKCKFNQYDALSEYSIECSAPEELVGSELRKKGDKHG